MERARRSKADVVSRNENPLRFPVIRSEEKQPRFVFSKTGFRFVSFSFIQAFSRVKCDLRSLLFPGQGLLMAARL